MEQCPLCFSTLEVRDCAPCHDCGGSPQELEHFAQGLHTYKIYEVDGKGRLTLCNFCEVDIGSYTPAYWGSLSKGIGYRDLAFVRELTSPRLVKDKVCPTCQHRVAFLSFVAAVRARAELGET